VRESVEGSLTLLRLPPLFFDRGARVQPVARRNKQKILQQQQGVSRFWNLVAFLHYRRA
jgi:hypothetical protein